MTQHGEKSGFSADIPAEAIAEAVAAVERHERPPDGAPDSEVGAGAPAAAGELDELRRALAGSEERAREAHDARLRAAADLENYRKRAARERDEVQRYGNERLVKELLPVLDSLDRALAAGADHPFCAGVELTRRLFEDVLARFGVKGFSARGQQFDPSLHEALMTVATADHPAGVVVDEQQRGFLLHDRLIRPAAVVVSAAPAPQDVGGGDPGAGS